MLEVEAIEAGYDAAKPVLAEMSLKVAQGEIVSLLGRSGCGKSTLLLLVAGFLKPAVGRVSFREQPVSDPAPGRILLTQSESTWPWKTALENVAFPLRCRGSARLEADTIASKWLDSVGLLESSNVYPAALSGGMRQRVGLAKVFALRPDLLLLDEPFGSLDELTRHAVNQVFLKLWQESRMSVILVTHSLDEALYLSDRLVVMGGKPGRVIGEFKNPAPRPARIEDTFHAQADALRAKVLSLLQENLLP